MKNELKEVKRLKVLSVAKIALILGIILGIFQGIFMGFSAQQTLAAYPDINSMSFSDESVAGNSQMILSLVIIRLGWWNVILMPIFLAVIWWLGALVFAWAYNVIAKYAGGIKIELA